MKNKREHKINEEITEYAVRIPEKGIVKTSDAIKMARDANMDLVLINSSAAPIICKIMNYEKFIYEQKKKGKPKPLDVKEIKVGPNTSENDLDYRIKHMSEFLQKGHKVKITMQFKGREMAFVSKGEQLMLNLILKLTDFGSAETMPKLEGKKMFVMIRPKSKN
jgi:translation initiation factor IF-3